MDDDDDFELNIVQPSGPRARRARKPRVDAATKRRRQRDAAAIGLNTVVKKLRAPEAFQRSSFKRKGGVAASGEAAAKAVLMKKAVQLEESTFGKQRKKSSKPRKAAPRQARPTDDVPLGVDDVAMSESSSSDDSESAEQSPKTKRRSEPAKEGKRAGGRRKLNLAFQRTTKQASVAEAPLRAKPPPEAVAVGENTPAFFSSDTWEGMDLTPSMCRALTHCGFDRPTKIQSAAVPTLLQGYDAMIRAETGSGKTLTYLVPLLENLQRRRPKITRSQGTFAIVLAPTRELVMQIYGEAQRLCRCSFNWIVCGFVTGGDKRKSEKARLRKGITVLVATPGRLLDHLNSTAALELAPLEWLIFDEADRLLDLGFEYDVKNIIRIVKERREGRSPAQAALVSATLWQGVRKLAALTLTKPKYVALDRIGTGEGDRRKGAGKALLKRLAEQDGLAEESLSGSSDSSDEGSAAEDETVVIVKEYHGEYDPTQQYSTPATLRQRYVVVECKQRLVLLATLLRWKVKRNPDSKVLVFFSNCDCVDYHYALFMDALVELEDGNDERVIPAKVYRLHGRMSQVDRSEVYRCFTKRDEGGVLLCTDVAARGLDLPNLTWIIQYDPPGEPKDYIHRVGRTARLGKAGDSLLFLLPTEVDYLTMMQHHGVHMTPISADSVLASLDLASAHKNIPAVTTLQLTFERMVEEDMELLQLASSALGSFLKAYATHARGTKHIFHPKKLHLGHVTKSLALKDAPSKVLARKRRNSQQAYEQGPTAEPYAGQSVEELEDEAPDRKRYYGGGARYREPQQRRGRSKLSVSDRMALAKAAGTNRQLPTMFGGRSASTVTASEFSSGF